MPGKVKVKLVSARNLPVMNTASQLTSAYAVIKLDDATSKTDVCRKTLNPLWNHVCTFEADDEELQDEILLIKLWDYDAVGNDDAIGQVMIDLDPLLKRDKPQEITGWFPVYDSIKGIRGAINVSVSINFMKDHNRYTEASAGVQIFTMTAVPECYVGATLLGFVEELIIKDDPEFQWMDRIRSPRASNEARQAVFAQLDGELQRRIGRKVLDMGGNAVLGYRQDFDLEGDSMVARGIGTAAWLRSPEHATPQLHHTTSVPMTGAGVLMGVDGMTSLGVPASSGSGGGGDRGGTPDRGTGSFGLEEGGGSGERGAGLSLSASHSGSWGSEIRHSQSIGGIPHQTPPRAPLISATPPRIVNQLVTAVHSPRTIPLITLTQFPRGVVLHLGGVVKACSIKLCLNDALETRDAWWNELRDEVRSHAQTLGYSAVVGYSETTSIFSGTCLLTAIGTAAVLLRPDRRSMRAQSDHAHWGSSTSTSGRGHPSRSGNPDDGEKSPSPIDTYTITSPRHDGRRVSYTFPDNVDLDPDGGSGNATRTTSAPATPRADAPPVQGESLYTEPAAPVRSCCASITLPAAAINGVYQVDPAGLRCRVCASSIVSDVIMCTVEPPSELFIVGQSKFVQARICRRHDRTVGKEDYASMIGGELPFLEHELNQQLLNKLKVTGRNALFNMRCHFSIGEDLVCAVATATAVYLPALPKPALLQILRHADVVDEEDAYLVQIQTRLMELSSTNREVLEAAEARELALGSGPLSLDAELPSPQEADATTPLPAAAPVPEETVARIRQNVVFHVDTETDEDIMAVLLDTKLPEGFYMCTTDRLPNLQSLGLEEGEACECITVIKRAALREQRSVNQSFASIFTRLLEVACFKVRKMVPCALCNIRIDLQTPDDDEVLVTMIGMAVALKPIEHPTDTPDPSSGSGPGSGGGSGPGSGLKHGLAFCDVVPEEDETCGSTDGGRASREPRQPVDATADGIFEFDEPEVEGGLEEGGSPGVTPPRNNHSMAHQQSPVITPLFHVPGRRIIRHLGTLSLYLIRETTSLRRLGGFDQFLRVFVAEVHAIARAHVVSRGGNALVGYRLKQPVLLENAAKNQGQCLLCVTGDVVAVVDWADSLAAAASQPVVRRHAASTSVKSDRMTSALRVAAGNEVRRSLGGQMMHSHT